MEAYQPPAEDTGAPRGYQSQLAVYVTASLALLVYGLLDLTGAILSLWRSYLYNPANRALITDAQANLDSVISPIHYDASTVWPYVCYFCFAVFLFSASRNARALGATGMRNTPLATVGWFFVPFANWFKPYSAVKELWQASGRIDRRSSPPGYLLLWWLSWLFMPVLSWLVPYAMDAGSLPREEFWMVQAAAGTLDLLPTVLAWRVIHSIYKRQQASATALGLLPAKAAS